MIDFARGHPNSSLLPCEATRRVLETLSQSDYSSSPSNVFSSRALQYGKENGSDEFLKELRAFLTRHTCNDDFGELQAEADGLLSEGDTANQHLFVTGGVSHGLELICATQTQPGDTVLVENPTYFLVGGIFQCHGLIVRGLPMKGETGGVDVDKLIELVDNGTMDAPKMIYVIPTHQNPTGHTMCIEDRIKLASFACQRGILIVADEVYHLLDWRRTERDGPRPARMSSISSLIEKEGSESGGCVSVSSFTKIYAPGMRCGWIEGTKDIVNSLIGYGYIQSQGGCAPFVGEIMRLALETRVADDVLNKLNMDYKIRSELLCSLLEAEPRIHVVNKPIGGYFVWIKFPNEVNVDDFLTYSRGRVKFMPGSRCDITARDGRPFASYARLCFADLDIHDVETGVVEFVASFREYTQSMGEN